MPEKLRTVKARTFKKSRCKTETRKNERTRRRLMIIASHISERVSSRPPGEWKGRHSGKLLFRGHMAARSRTNGSSNSLPGGPTFSGGSCLFAPPAEVAPPQITKQWFSYRQKNHKSNHFQQLPDMTRRDGHQGLVQWSLLPLLDVCVDNGRQPNELWWWKTMIYRGFSTRVDHPAQADVSFFSTHTIPSGSGDAHVVDTSSSSSSWSNAHFTASDVKFIANCCVFTRRVFSQSLATLPSESFWFVHIQQQWFPDDTQ